MSRDSQPKYMRGARSSALPGTVRTPCDCVVDTVGIRSNFRERARKMAPSGGVSGSVLGRVAVELQHLQWVDVIRSTAKTYESYVMSCMRNLHTILVRRVISGELFRFLGTNLETKHLVSDSWVIALCFYSWSSDQPKSETGLKPRFPQNRFSINPVDIMSNQSFKEFHRLRWIAYTDVACRRMSRSF